MHRKLKSQNQLATVLLNIFHNRLFKKFISFLLFARLQLTHIPLKQNSEDLLCAGRNLAAGLTWPCHPSGITDCLLHFSSRLPAALHDSSHETVRHWSLCSHTIMLLTLTRLVEHIFRLSRGQGLTPDSWVPREKVQGIVDSVELTRAKRKRSHEEKASTVSLFYQYKYSL